MQRVKNWEQKLEDYLAKQSNRAFHWGKFDCVLMASGALKKIYGTNPLDLMETRYTSKTSGLKAISELGEGSLWAATDVILKKYGFERTAINYAEHGDVIGALNHEGLEMVGIMEDPGTCTFASEQGLARLPITEIKVRWSPCQS